MTLATREQGLIKLVETYQAEQCQRLIEGAEGSARALMQGAYRNARRQLHQRVLSERERAVSRIAAARAELATHESRTIERLHWRVLEAAWPRLREVLLERWRSPKGRWAWVERAVSDAAGILPRQAWLLRHPAELGGEEQARLRQELIPLLSGPPGFAMDAALVAGVRIHCGEAILDASLDGLLADRRRLEARLLGLFAGGAA